MKLFGKLLSLALLLFLINACTSTADNNETNTKESLNYGVFLSLEGEDAVKASEGHETVVIDAQYLSKKEISFMQERNQKVYSYLNVGSLETFRPYYEEYKNLELKEYRNWENEYWIDVSNKDWQDFIYLTLSKQLVEKGIDGFWVDNIDVYGQFPNEETYKGIEMILKNMMTYGKPVVLNSGNEFVEVYFRKNQQVDDILTGVNQETVFSSIDFEKQTFGIQTTENQSYYLDYLNFIDELDKDIYLLEYTTDEELIKKIESYTEKRNWKFYISHSIELNAK